MLYVHTKELILILQGEEIPKQKIIAENARYIYAMENVLNATTHLSNTRTTTRTAANLLFPFDFVFFKDFAKTEEVICD